jgi:hypothetical protein
MFDSDSDRSFNRFQVCLLVMCSGVILSLFLFFIYCIYNVLAHGLSADDLWLRSVVTECVEHGGAYDACLDSAKKLARLE